MCVLSTLHEYPKIQTLGPRHPKSFQDRRLEPLKAELQERFKHRSSQGIWIVFVFLFARDLRLSDAYLESSWWVDGGLVLGLGRYPRRGCWNSIVAVKVQNGH